MERPKCEVKNCENGAMILYGMKWICGECYYKIMLKEQQDKTKRVEEMEI